MKIIKYSLLALLVILASGIYYLATLDLNQYKDEMVTQARQATGRELRIDGDLRFALSLLPTIAVERVRLANAAWASQVDLLKVGRFEARVSLLPLLSGRVHVSSLALQDLDLALETDKSGMGNWVFDSAGKLATAPPTPTSETAALPAVLVQKILIEDARITFKDGRSGRVTAVVAEEVVAHTDSFGDPVQISLKAAYNSIPVTVNGRLGTIEALVSNKPYPIDLEAMVRNLSLKLSGEITEPLAGKGLHLRIAAALPSLAELSEYAHAEMPPVGPVSLAATLVAPAPALIQLDGLKLSAGPSDLGGEVSLKLDGTRPALSARLSSQLLDLTPFLGEEEEKKRKPERIFSKEKLPLDSFQAVNADIQIVIKQLKNGESVLQEVHLPLKLQNGRLAVAPLKARLAGGDIAISMDLDTGKPVPELKTDISVKQLELGQLPKIKEKAQLTGGKMDIAFQGAGRGTSVADIMASLSGSLLVQVGKGTIPNSRIDLAGADILLETFSKLNPLAQKEPSSELECAVVNFAIKDGMATTDKGIALQTSKMNVVGSGAVNLKTEALDIGMRPHAREGVGVNLGNIPGAARLGGTLADPKPAIDAAGVLRAGVSAGAAVATFGLSFLAEGMLDKAVSDPNPCETALGRKPAPTPKTTTASSTEMPAGATKEKTSSTSANPIQGAADAVKGALDGLFGK